jgi:hypothetical protein
MGFQICEIETLTPPLSQREREKSESPLSPTGERVRVRGPISLI